MKTLFKALGWILAGLVVVVASLVTYLNLAFPKVGPAPDLKVELTPARVERGRYLAHYVADCVGCHSPRLLDVYGIKHDEAREFEGGFELSKVLEGLPGEFTTPNLTPVNLASWTDGEIYRAFTSGVNKEGRPLFPLMPYGRYGAMDKEDALSIIAYLRTLKPAGAMQPKNKLAFPFSLIARTIPQPPAHQPRPDGKDPVALGRYLVNTAACFDCHTPIDEHHKPIASREGAGGQEFIARAGGVRIVFRPPNITPDPETGIGAWSKKDFITTIRTRAQPMVKRVKVPLGEPNHIMPYAQFARLSDQDLGAMYDYLRTLPPIKNKVVRFEKL